MRAETGSWRSYKGSNKKFSAKLEVSRGRGLAQAAALGHKVWRDKYTSGCRSNGA